uniref:Huntingtin-associated protein 1 n=1 Tax=Taeniopygia guttata TaxID=59729 RepID=A0A674GUS5_TAEGU
MHLLSLPETAVVLPWWALPPRLRGLCCAAAGASGGRGPQHPLPQREIRAGGIWGRGAPIVWGFTFWPSPPVLCAERVVRITKTYHDIDAVTNLLDEKERDLELAARIGQSLLKQNRSLTERNELLEEHSGPWPPVWSPLRHEVSMRDDLLHFYATTTEESEPTTTTSTPLRRHESSLSLQQYFQYDTLQQKLKCLEEENQKLRMEATNIATETCQYEDQEQQLMIDCVEQFSQASQQVAHLSEELAHRAEEAARQQEEITQLLAQVAELQQKCRTVRVEELQQHLSAAKEVQQQLRMEVRGEEPAEPQRDSLAAEIKGMMRKRTDSSCSDYNCQRVFDTVRAVNRTAKAKSCSESPHHVPGSEQLSTAHSGGGSTPHTDCSGSEGNGARWDGGCSCTGAGVLLTTPGRRDLEAAVQRLSVRQQSHVSEERSFFEAERERKLRRLRDGESSSGFLSPEGSVVSTGTNYSGGSELTAGSSFSLGSLAYLPDKLQIVKPLEGSVTLHHWQQLAQPNLGGILVPRPGVLTKDFRQLDIDLEEVYSLNDLEEDDVDASSFQLLPTSTPAKAKERSRGERGVRGRSPRGAPPAFLSRLGLASPRALPSCSSLSLPRRCPRGDAPPAAAQGPFSGGCPGGVSPPHCPGEPLLPPGCLEGAGLGQTASPGATCAGCPL